MWHGVRQLPRVDHFTTTARRIKLWMETWIQIWMQRAVHTEKYALRYKILFIFNYVSLG